MVFCMGLAVQIAVSQVMSRNGLGLDGDTLFWESKRAETYRHSPHCSTWFQCQRLFPGLLHLLVELLGKKKDTLPWERLCQCKPLPASSVPMLCESNINDMNHPGVNSPSKHIPDMMLGGNTWVTFALWGRNYWHVNFRSAWKVPSKESFPNDVMGAGILYKQSFILKKSKELYKFINTSQRHP